MPLDCPVLKGALHVYVTCRHSQPGEARAQLLCLPWNISLGDTEIMTQNDTGISAWSTVEPHGNS